MDERKPNWREWLSVPTVKLHEAVALSLGIDPHKVEPEPASWMAGRLLFREVDEFQRRLRSTERSAEDGGALDVVWIGGESRLRLGQFVLWAQGIDWSMPDELTELAAEQEDMGAQGKRDEEVKIAEEAEARMAAEARADEEALTRRSLETRLAEEVKARCEAEERLTAESEARRIAEARASEEEAARHAAEAKMHQEGERAALAHKPVGGKERETYLKLIYGMAVAGYRYNPKAKKTESVVPDICEDLKKNRVPLSDDTVRRKLEEAVVLVEGRQKGEEI